MINKRNIIGIDATNLHAGGGVTHILELLNAAEPERFNFSHVVIYGSDNILNKINDRSWLIKRTHPLLNKGFIARLMYLKLWFDKQLKDDECSVLYVPGGAYDGKFRPFITMCRNMLVFEQQERKHVGFNKVRLRLKILEKFQKEAFLKANKIIFLSEYAKMYVTAKIRLGINKATVIHHGISSRFSNLVKSQQAIQNYTFDNPYKILYVSIIDFYKHHCEVIEAVTKLRIEDNYAVELHIVGDHYRPALKKVTEVIKRLNSDRFIILHGAVKYENLDKVYKSSDAFVFASSCENMPNILIEAMHTGLPVACSNSGPMSEFLKDAGVYFDPYSADSIYYKLKRLIDDPDLRFRNASKAVVYSNEYNWEKCAAETFQLLKDVSVDFYKKNKLEENKNNQGGRE